MTKRLRMLLSVTLLLTCVAAAKIAAPKDKKKDVLPASVLRARTVLVLIDPETGVSMTDPGGNNTARDEVEKALLKWGRFSLVLDGESSDLVIVVRKGHGKHVEPTIGGVPNGNDRPVVLQPTDNGVHIGVQQGHPTDATPRTQTDTTPHTQVEMGPAEDLFAVYEGGKESVLDYPPVWRYIKKDALHSPDVPAVEEFRKAIAETEKQQQKTTKP
jgi:hypothetical protein